MSERKPRKKSKYPGLNVVALRKSRGTESEIKREAKSSTARGV